MEIQQDNFNSEIFGFKMGNIILTSDEMKDERLDVKGIVEKGRSEKFAHITIKIPSLNKAILNAFAQNGFLLTDTLLEYIYKFDGRTLLGMTHKTILRDYKEGDLEGLMRIAKRSFDHDRFHSDPALDNELCDKYYEQWICNSCHGFADKVIVSEYENSVVGFTTGKADRSYEYGRLVLSAVSNDYRGLGIYTSMIYEGVKWLEKEGFRGVVVGTQINNIAVQKAWIKLGFTVLGSSYILQKYIGE